MAIFNYTETNKVLTYLVAEFGFTKKNAQTIVKVLGDICADYVTIGTNFDENTIVQIEATNRKAKEYVGQATLARLVARKPEYPNKVIRCIRAQDALVGKLTVLNDMIDALFDGRVQDFITRVLSHLHEKEILEPDVADLIVTGRRNNELIQNKGVFSMKAQILSGKYA
jgi:hypothetical protein